MKKALEDCAVNQVRQQMRAALAKSEWSAARLLADQVLAARPGDDEAVKAVKACGEAVTIPSEKKE